MLFMIINVRCTYQGLGAGEGLQILGFGQLGNKIFWVNVHLKHTHDEDVSYSSVSYPMSVTPYGSYPLCQ